MVTNTLYIVSAPSGAGKTSLLKSLLDEDKGISVSVSHTTRAMRPGEVDGVHYHFVDTATFIGMVGEGAFIEHAEVFGNFYGTAEAALAQQLAQGDKDVVLEIDWQGARQVRKRFPDAISIFVLPPSPEALHSRLTARGQDSEDVIARRMRAAAEEMSHYGEYDYLVINNVFEQALAELKCIVCAQRLRGGVQAERLGGKISQLLSFS